MAACLGLLTSYQLFYLLIHFLMKGYETLKCFLYSNFTPEMQNRHDMTDGIVKTSVKAHVSQRRLIHVIIRMIT